MAANVKKFCDNVNLLNSPQEYYSQELNDEQRKAVETTQGPLLILAGAGTGKTKVLTTRIAYLLSHCLAHPRDILAVTFTNKASLEMRQRVAANLGTSTEGIWMGTFHGLGLRMLRAYGSFLGFEENFTIIDPDDQLRLIRQIVKSEGIDEKKYDPKGVLNHINRYKDQGILSTSINRDSCRNVYEYLYVLYQDRLKLLNSVDFGDLLLQCFCLFQNHPSILQRYQEQFRYILVDEYQDTNTLQYRWLQLLAQGHRNICCVGDDDQSIYSWRGADVGNILSFEKDYPDATIIRLEQNYRSSGHILAAASGLIAHNTARLGKTLWTKDGQGKKILVRGAWDSGKEARLIADMIYKLHHDGLELRHMAVLVRASFQTREIEERFLNVGIAYRFYGGVRFYERQEIRDAIAYLRLLIQPNDSLAFERIINTPKRGIGPSSIQKIQAIATQQSISIPKAAWIFANEPSTRPAVKSKLLDFFHSFEQWRNLINTKNPSDIVSTVLEESGYMAMWKAVGSTDGQSRLENLKELIRAIGEFGHLGSFLDHVSLVMDHQDNSPNDQVTIMTLHAAKGLEFKAVFLPGWEEGTFPHGRCLQENGKEGLEEERRLGYVGISRARSYCIITYCLSRYSHYQGWSATTPSRFIYNLPKDHIDHIHPNGNRII